MGSRGRPTDGARPDEGKAGGGVAVLTDESDREVNQQPDLVRSSTMNTIPFGESEFLTDRAGATVLPGVESFDSFYRREMPGLVLLARALSGSASADDIAQDAMFAAFERWDTVCGYDSPSAWVRKVCANRAVSALRRRAAEGRALLRLQSRAQDASPELSDEADAFWTEVRRLPRRQAQSVALFYLYDLSVAEVAATLGCSEGSIKVHLSRGRAALARRLDENLEESS